MKTFRMIATVLLLSMLWVGMAHACPTCKNSVAENGGNLVQGYFWSIIFMMSMPFLIFSGLSMMFYLDVRRARRRNRLAADQASLSVGSV